MTEREATALMKTSFLLLAVLSLLCLPPSLHAQTIDADKEIEYLIRAVGRNGCAFIRNDRKYSTREARQHLQSKVERNAHLIDSTEEFIEKIASRSSTSGDAYLIDCRDQPPQTANEWFRSVLENHRASQGNTP